MIEIGTAVFEDSALEFARPDYNMLVPGAVQVELSGQGGFLPMSHIPDLPMKSNPLSCPTRLAAAT
jgi:hypothetical protein